MEAFKKFVVDEWYFAAPMFAMSLVAFALVFWRLLLNMNSGTNMDDFLPDFQDKLKKDGVDGALKLCRTEPGVIPSKLFAVGLENAKQGTAAMKRSMANTIELEILPRLNFLLAPILGIAKIATMVGLFGTVVSMINTFNAIGQAKGDPSGASSHAGAIGLALFATALGLMTAIPLVFMHVMFKDWIARFEIKMKSSAQKLILLVQNTKPPKAGASANMKRVAASDERE